MDCCEIRVVTWGEQRWTGLGAQVRSVGEVPGSTSAASVNADYEVGGGCAGAGERRWYTARRYEQPICRAGRVNVSEKKQEEWLWDDGKCVEATERNQAFVIKSEVRYWNA